MMIFTDKSETVPTLHDSAVQKLHQQIVWLYMILCVTTGIADSLAWKRGGETKTLKMMFKLVLYKSNAPTYSYIFSSSMV